MRLSDCATGQIVQITQLCGELALKMRLVNLGFHTHSVVELLVTRGSNFVVNVDGSRFALDQQIARQIEVERRS
ncbi:MAG: ferrous iron transport protein A [Thiotrichales bacterium]|nr:ferrous iron transport protein A [Thiotrichales bacterium]